MSMRPIKIDSLISKDDIQEIFDDEIESRVDEIRSNGFPQRNYTQSTKMRRKRFGLQTNFVDLTGNRGYSRKNWRFLDDWYTKMKGKFAAIIMWHHPLSRTLLRVHTKRFGKIFEENKK